MAKTTELELAIRIAGKVDPSLQAAIRQAQGGVGNLTKTMSRIGTAGLGLMAGTLAASAVAIADCTKEAEKFESQMAPVVRYVDGLADATGKVSDATAENGKTFKENYGAMATYIQDLSTSIPKTTEQLTAMSAALGQSGKGVDEQLNTSILRDTAVAATAMDLDDNTAGNYMAKWEEAFNFSHDQVMGLMDQINYLGAHYATTAAEIAQSVNQAGSMGQIAGLDPAATAALATAMQATGVATDRVGTSITRMYTNLSKGESATKAQKEMLEELGLTATGVAKGLQSDGVGTLKEVFTAIQNLPSERRVAALSTLFGQWAIEGGAKVVNNLDVYEKALADVQNPGEYTGSMEREFIINASTSESLGVMMKNAMTALKQDFGEDFLPVKKQFAALAIDIMNGLRKNAPELQTLAGTLADIATKGVAALGDALQKALPYIQAGLDYVSQNGETVVKVLAGLAGGFAAMSAAPLLNSLGGGAVSAAGLGAKGVSWLMSKGQAAGGGLMNGLGTLGGMIQTSNMYGQMTGQGTTGVLAKALWSSLKGSNLGKEVGRNLGNAKGWGSALFGNLKGFAGAQWQAAQGAANGIQAGVNGLGGWINSMIQGGSSTALTVPGTSLAVPGTSLAAAGATPSNASLLWSVLGKGGGQSPLKAAGSQLLGGLGGMLSNGAGALGTFWAPFAGMFGSILSSALPLVGVMGAIAAAVSLLGDNLDNVRTAIGNVFGDTGVAVFDGFLGKITAVKDAVLGVFSPENLANARQAIVGLFGENAGTGFDNLISIGQAVVGVFKQIGDFGVQVIKPIFEQIWGFISGTFLPGMLTLFNAVAPIVSQLISSVGSAVVGVATLIGQAIQIAMPIVEGIITAIMGIVTVAAPAVLGSISAIADGIAGVVGAVQGVFDGLITFVTGVFTMNWGQAWEGVKAIFGSAFDGLVELCKTPINAVIGIINGAISGINSIFGNGVTIPNWVPKVGGKSFSMNLKTIPALATGGFTDGVSIAGEAGTEAVISFDPAYRASNLANWQKAGRMLGVKAKEVNTSGGRSGGSVSVSFAPNITIQGNADRDTVAQAMAEAKEQFAAWLEEYMRKQQRTAYATR